MKKIWGLSGHIMHLKNKAEQKAGKQERCRLEFFFLKKGSLCMYIQQKPLTVSMSMCPWPKRLVISKSICYTHDKSLYSLSNFDAEITHLVICTTFTQSVKSVIRQLVSRNCGNPSEINYQSGNKIKQMTSHERNVGSIYNFWNILTGFSFPKEGIIIIIYRKKKADQNIYHHRLLKTAVQYWVNCKTKSIMCK